MADKHFGKEWAWNLLARFLVSQSWNAKKNMHALINSLEIWKSSQMKWEKKEKKTSVGEKSVWKKKARFERIFEKKLKNVDYEMNS